MESQLLAEKSMIGAILLDSSIYSQYSEILLPEYFTNTAIRKIYLAIRQVADEGFTPVLSIITSKLKATQGIASFLTDCIELIPSSNQATYFFKQLQKNYYRSLYQRAVVEMPSRKLCKG